MCCISPSGSDRRKVHISRSVATRASGGGPPIPCLVHRSAHSCTGLTAILASYLCAQLAMHQLCAARENDGMRRVSSLGRAAGGRLRHQCRCVLGRYPDKRLRKREFGRLLLRTVIFFGLGKVGCARSDQLIPSTGRQSGQSTTYSMPY